MSEDTTQPTQAAPEVPAPTEPEAPATAPTVIPEPEKHSDLEGDADHSTIPAPADVAIPGHVDHCRAPHPEGLTCSEARALRDATPGSVVNVNKIGRAHV